jgi:O-antigen ligase
MKSSYKVHIPLVNFYSLTIASFGFGTLSIGEVAGANVRVWELFLFFFVCGQILKKRVGLPNIIPIILSTLVALSILLSGLNALDGFIFIKQSILCMFMLLLFLVGAGRNTENNLISLIRWVIYPSVLVAGWGLFELYLHPDTLTVYSSELGLWVRARSFFSEANEFSQYLSVPFGFLLGMLFYYKPLSRGEKFLLLFSLLIIITAQTLSFSRGGILSFLFELITWLFLIYSDRNSFYSLMKKTFRFLLVLFFVIVALLLVDSVFVDIFLIILERFSSLFSSSDVTTFTRIDTINAAVSASFISLSSILFGIGFGNLPQVLGEGVANSGNSFVDILSELGLLGAVSFVGLISACLVLPMRTKKLLDKTKDSRMLAIFYGAYLSFAGLLVGGLTSPTHMLNIFWFCAGTLMALYIFGLKIRKSLDLKTL